MKEALQLIDDVEKTSDTDWAAALPTTYELHDQSIMHVNLKIDGKQTQSRPRGEKISSRIRELQRRN